MSQFEGSFQTNASSPGRNLVTLLDILVDCRRNGHHPMHLPINVIVLGLGFPANAVLLVLLLKNRKSLTPSEVLGLNFALFGIQFCLGLALDTFVPVNNLILSVNISYTIAMLSYFGCPLLLTCMCVERYVAVSHPVLFMKLGKWEYRAACSAIIWILTCLVATLTFIYTISITALPMSILFNLMFLTMVACLLGIVRVLRQKGPGDGEQDTSPIKKRALKNILAVLIPSTIIYSPILGLPPVLAIAPMLAQNGTSPLMCMGLLIASLLPHFGVCIGPIFYMARVRQMLCGGNNARETRP